MDTLIMDMDTGAERREKLKLLLKLQLLLILMLRLIPGMDTMVDTMDMDTLVDTIVLTDIYGAERRGKLKLLLRLRLIPGMDMVIYMDIVHTMVILMLDTTGVNEEQDCNICKHL